MGKSKQNKVCGAFVFVGCFLFLSACAKKSDVQQANGDVLVKIGIQESASEYNLKIVQLKGIQKLDEVSGAFARFFYAPGSNGTSLTGSAPRAQFIQSQNFFVPTDVISMQMSAIYYHLQSLAAFDKEVGADKVNHWPRAVGIETQVTDGQSSFQKNNAFYNGQTDSMMFVPYTNSNLPISVNAGIIAHEHFHSLFYKLVILPAFQTQKISAAVQASVHVVGPEFIDQHHKVFTNVRTAIPLDAPPQIDESEAQKIQAYNETYLRGVNEGLADFWGWVYTDDPEFMRWSLPEYQADRTLTMSAQQEGRYETKNKILKRVEQEMEFSRNLNAALVNYSYEVGTPHARFLKRLSVLQAVAQKISLSEAKKIVAQAVFHYMKDLGHKMQTLQNKETIDPLSLFDYVAKLADEKSLIRLDQSSCDFLVKYFNHGLNERQKRAECKERETERLDGVSDLNDSDDSNQQQSQEERSFAIVRAQKMKL